MNEWVKIHRYRYSLCNTFVPLPNTYKRYPVIVVLDQVLRLCAILWVMADRKISLRTCSSLALFFCPFLLFLVAVLALPATFGFFPSEFSQADLHLLNHFFALILTPSP